MEDKLSMQNCTEDDVLLFGDTMFKVDKLRQEVNKLLYEYKLGEQLSSSFSSQNLRIDVGTQKTHNSRDYRISYEKWFGDGINCEILRLGADGWKKGKVRMKLEVSIEFCPDEPEVEETPARNEVPQPESPLDDLRQMMNQETQQ